jgi:hypothetical protein
VTIALGRRGQDGTVVPMEKAAAQGGIDWRWTPPLMLESTPSRGGGDSIRVLILQRVCSRWRLEGVCSLWMMEGAVSTRWLYIYRYLMEVDEDGGSCPHQVPGVRWVKRPVQAT